MVKIKIKVTPIKKILKILGISLLVIWSIWGMLETFATSYNADQINVLNQTLSQYKQGIQNRNSFLLSSNGKVAIVNYNESNDSLFLNFLNSIIINNGYGTVYYTSPLSQTGFTCTGSMKPTLNCGDIALTITPKSPTEINVGDIINFKAPMGDVSSINDCSATSASYYVHRVVNVKLIDNRIFYETKGDNNQYSDYCLVPFNNVISKVVGIIYNAYPS